MSTTDTLSSLPGLTLTEDKGENRLPAHLASDPFSGIPGAGGEDDKPW